MGKTGRGLLGDGREEMDEGIIEERTGKKERKMQKRNWSGGL